MKTEDFDDAIRRKLESISNTHLQSDVNAVHEYVLSQKSNASKKRAAFIILLSSSLLIIGLLFTWNLSQVKEINSLKLHIATLNKKAHKNTVDRKTENSKPVSEIRKRFTSHVPASNLPKVKGSAISNSNNNIKSTDKEISNYQRKFSASRQATAIVHSSITEQKLPDITEKTEMSGIPSVDSSNLERVKEDKAKLSNELNKPAELNEDTLPVDFVNSNANVFADSLRRPNPEADSTTHKPANEPSFNYKIWDYRAGIGLEAGNYQLGFGILGEAVYKKRWAISAGIKLLKNGTETFDDDDDYDDHKHKEFKQTYGNHVDNDSKDIKIRNTLFQIPLTISYIFPIKNNFSILAGAGTDIDIYTKQHVEYRRNNVANDMTTQFVSNYPPAYFNNIVITGGIQKQFRRFVFQCSPYLSPQLKQVDYKKENLYFGLRVRSYFAF